MKICTSRSVRDAEQKLFASGEVTSLALMNTVIDRLWHACGTEPLLRGFTPARVVVYAGSGNNAGDAIGLAARFACPVTLRCAGPLAPDAAAQLCGREEEAATAPAPQVWVQIALSLWLVYRNMNNCQVQTLEQYIHKVQILFLKILQLREIYLFRICMIAMIVPWIQSILW